MYYPFDQCNKTRQRDTHMLLFAQLSGAVLFFECVRQCVLSARRVEACYETFHDRVVNSLLHFDWHMDEAVFCDHVWRYAPKRNGTRYKPRLFLNFSRLGTGTTVQRIRGTL